MEGNKYISSKPTVIRIITLYLYTLLLGHMQVVGICPCDWV